VKQIDDGPALKAWLKRLEARNPREIELGLDRVRTVFDRLAPNLAGSVIITVGGTNGKGSTVACLDGLFRAAGYSVMTYTSPHILQFAERMGFDGSQLDEQAIVESMERVEACRDSTPLTYFEHTTLAFFDQAGTRAPDVIVLEVGLGGRLDAVNVVDPDVAIVTTVALDHQDWLGADLDSIGREKAGIARPGRPLIIGQHHPPEGLVAAVEQIGGRIFQAGRDFDWQNDPPGWTLDWPGGSHRFAMPDLAGRHQLANPACAWMAARCLADRLDCKPEHLAVALEGVQLPGRFQRLPGRPEIILDVAHNPQAARGLADALGDGAGKTLAVFAMLADKDAGEVARALAGHVDHWFCAGLGGVRGRKGADLADCVRHITVTAPVEALESVPVALSRALEVADRSDRVLVFGSFHTVGEALKALNRSH